MKPIQFIKLTICSAVLAVLPIGCSHQENHAKAESEEGSAAETSTGVSFSPKSGLHVPAETAKFIGLQVADVEERKVLSSLRFTAQVFRSASDVQLVSLKGGALPTLASGLVSPGEAKQLRAGQLVKIENRAGESGRGRVAHVKDDLGSVNGMVEVVVEILDRTTSPGVGSFVTITVPTGKEENVVSVPRSALLRTSEGNFVYAVSGDRFVRAAVKLGVVNGEFAEVADGLYAGDQIAVKPIMSLWLAELQAIRGGKACSDD